MKTDIVKQLEELDAQITGEMTEEQFALRKRIAELRIELNKTELQKPDDSQFECFGCGS
jgi:hypothetical protein